MLILAWLVYKRISTTFNPPAPAPTQNLFLVLVLKWRGPTTWLMPGDAAQPRPGLPAIAVSAQMGPGRHSRMRDWNTDTTWPWTSSRLTQQVFEHHLGTRYSVHHCLCQVL